MVGGPNQALDFLASQLGSDGRSKSYHLSGAKAIKGRGNVSIGNMRGLSMGPLARVKKNLYETSKQISRYRQINKSSTLADRLNRMLPSNTNFPETQLREKISSTGMETSKKFKLADAQAAFVGNINS